MKYTIFLLLPWLLMAQTEEQSYEVVQTKSDFEIRYYPPVMMAAYVSDSNNSSGFRSLFRYISGSNQSQTKIAMTTPVHMEKQEQGNSMAFVLPKKFDPKTTPLPSDSQVKVYESKGGYYASMRYSGYTNEAKEKNYTAQLKTSLEKEGIQIAGLPKVFVYNSPFNFMNRRNEISFPIVWNE
jgi:hypothetical protein